MMDLIQRVTRGRHTSYVQTPFSSGDTVEVNVKVKEGEKERTQIFRGTVTKIQGRGMSKTFTVRKISDGIGVERSFPYSSPMVESVKLIAHGTVRRSRLFYLRGLKGKKARIDFELVAETQSEANAAKAVQKAAKNEANAAAKKAAESTKN